MKANIFTSRVAHAADGVALSRRQLLWRGSALALSPLALALPGCGGGADDSDDGLGAEPPLPPGASCPFWNTGVKVTVITAVTVGGDGIFPGAGTFAGSLLGVMWPSCGGAAAPDDVLSRADVVKIVNQTNAVNSLNTVRQAITQYHAYVNQTPTPSLADIKDAFVTCFNTIQSRETDFQPSGDEAALLPMYALYGHLFLSVAVDAQVNAAAWGFDDNSSYVQAGAEFLKRATPFVNQIAEWSYMGKVGSSAINAVDYHACEPFRTANAERTRLRTDALDLAVQWPYIVDNLSTGKKPDGGLVAQREVFYGPYGTGDDSGLIMLPLTSATAPPLSMSINSGLRLDAVQATYSPGTGPDGVTTTPKMGDDGGGLTEVTSANTINSATVWSGDIVNGLRFNYSAGGTTSLLGGTNGTQQEVTPKDSLLSSVYVNGVSSAYGSADTFVVGFVQDPTKVKSDTT